MIKARIKQDKDYYAMTLDGHAGYNNEGKDIVCAAVSTVFYSLVLMLSNCEGADVTYSDVPGNSNVVCKGTSEEIMAAYKMARLTLLHLAKQYPQNIKIIVEL